MFLENVKAIVSGAASGLGRGFALELVRAGASVAAADIDVGGLEKLKTQCEDHPGRLLTRKVDISQENSVTAFIAEVAKEFEGVNCLVNNAGILRDGLLAKEETGWVKKLPTAQWKQVLEVNLTGHYLMAREFAAEILRRGIKESVIVNISSISSAGNPGQSNYAASKAGLDACTRTWALELAPNGIRVAGIAPGVIETPILNNISAEAKEDLLEKIPLQRFGAPYEIWQALRFIIECEYFTGRIIYVDGGSNF